MFFDRSGSKSNASFSESQVQSSNGRPGRNLAALGLAAAMAVPMALSQFTTANAAQPAADPAAQPAAGNAELIALGRQQFDKRQYEQAEKTLAAVRTIQLSDKDRDAYLSLMTDVKQAAIECRTARQELANANDAAKAQQMLEAVAHYKAVCGNHYADEATLKLAQTKLQSLIAQLKDGRLTGPEVASTPTTRPAVADANLTSQQRYDLGVSQYRSGDWANARQNLQLAMAAGYKPASIYQDGPSEILKRMDLRDRADRERVQHLMQVSNATTSPAEGGQGAPDALSALKATSEGQQARRADAQSRSQDLVRQAQQAEQANDYQRALDLYSQAAEADPGNAAAVQGRDHVLVMMGRSPAPTNLANQVSTDIQARRGEITYQIQSNLDQARAAIQQQSWGTAQTDIDRARLAAAADPTIFSAEEIRRFHNQIDQADLDLRQSQERAQQSEQSRTTSEIERRIQTERQRAIRERQRTIADLIRTSQTLTNQGRYKEALQTVDQILILDPTNDYAVGVRPLLQDKNQFAQERFYQEMRDRAENDQFVRSEEELVPYTDILRYPTDWPDISQIRDQTVAAERGGHGTDRAVQAQLDKTLPEVAFDAVGFSDVVDFLRDVSGVNLFVNWKSLEAAGIDRNTPVTARLHNVKFSKALTLILDSVGGGQTKLGYTVDEGVVTISTADDLSKNVVVQVYDIRDLIIDVPDFTDLPQPTLGQQQSNSGGGSSGIGQGGGGGQVGVSNQLFQNSNQNGNQNQGPTRQDLVDAITKLIEDTIATDTWKDNGGSVGALRELQGQLIVTQTPENHRQLINLLDQLREERAIQVTVETRFLTVQRNFLEDVGVDLNMLFNLNSSWSQKIGTIPLSGPSSAFVQAPTTGVPGSIAAGTTTPTSLTTGFTYLDDFQVQLLLRAVQASVYSTIVNAPRLTLFNGQRAYVLVTLETGYVSNLVPIVSTGISAFAPVPGYVLSGVALDVQATVSADRKYVTLTLRPWLSSLVSITNFTFQTGTSAAASTGIFGTIGSASPSATVQLPDIQYTAVKTTVSVPDGGTLLLGGQTVAGETIQEIGVPVLSKIPFLKRAFTSQSIAKDEHVLLILVRPTIIMQREIEQKQFPLLSSKLSNGQ